MAQYGPEAQELVAREMKELKAGKLRSGSGQKVTNPKQAIAIALSEARREGVKMPEPPPGTPSAEKAPADKRAAARKKAEAKTPAARKKTPAKSTGTKTAAKKTSGKGATGKVPAKGTSGKRTSASRSAK